MPQIEAIAHTYFMKAELKGKKPTHIEQLNALIEKHPSVLSRIDDSLATASALGAAPAAEQQSVDVPIEPIPIGQVHVLIEHTC